MRGVELLNAIRAVSSGDSVLPAAIAALERPFERRLQEDLRLYADQIHRAHEEERKRIARDLHDDTVQTMVALSRRLDTF